MCKTRRSLLAPPSLDISRKHLLLIRIGDGIYILRLFRRRRHGGDRPRAGVDLHIRQRFRRGQSLRLQSLPRRSRACRQRCKASHGRRPARQGGSRLGELSLPRPLSRRKRGGAQRRAKRDVLAVLASDAATPPRGPGAARHRSRKRLRRLEKQRRPDFADHSGRCLSRETTSFGALVIDAVHFVPQSRKRVFVVAFQTEILADAGILRQAPSPAWHPPALREAVSAFPEAARRKWVWWNFPQPPVRNSTLAEYIDDEPEGVEWHSAEETSRILALMSPLNLEKVEAAKKSQTESRRHGLSPYPARRDGRKSAKSRGSLRRRRGVSSNAGWRIEPPNHHGRSG